MPALRCSPQPQIEGIVCIMSQRANHFQLKPFIPGELLQEHTVGKEAPLKDGKRRPYQVSRASAIPPFNQKLRRRAYPQPQPHHCQPVPEIRLHIGDRHPRIVQPGGIHNIHALSANGLCFRHKYPRYQRIFIVQDTPSLRRTARFIQLKIIRILHVFRGGRQRCFLTRYTVRPVHPGWVSV